MFSAEMFAIILQDHVNKDLEVLLQRKAALDLKMQSLQSMLWVWFSIVLSLKCD